MIIDSLLQNDQRTIFFAGTLFLDSRGVTYLGKASDESVACRKRIHVPKHFIAEQIAVVFTRSVAVHNRIFPIASHNILIKNDFLPEPLLIFFQRRAVVRRQKDFLIFALFKNTDG